MSRGLTSARFGRLIALLTILGTTAVADEEPARVKPPILPPTVPAQDFSEQPAYPVVDIRAGNVIVIQLPGERRVVRLLGTYVPSAGAVNDEARPFLNRMLTGESVYVAYEADWPLRDRHERYWAYVYRAPDGLPVNLELIRQGYARLSAQAPFEHQRLYRLYEKFARSTKKGVWQPSSQKTTATTQPAKSTTRAPEGQSTPQPADPAKVIVYKTPSGTKYHRAECSYLSDNTQPLTVAEAKALGLEPCSRCDPPE